MFAATFGLDTLEYLSCVKEYEKLHVHKSWVFAPLGDPKMIFESSSSQSANVVISACPFESPHDQFSILTV